MKKKTDFKKFLSTLQIILIIALAGLFFVLSANVAKLQGSAHVITTAGMVRGGTQLLAKEELCDSENPDLNLQANLDEMLSGLMNGGSKYNITRLDDEDYQQKLSQLSLVWEHLKTEMANHRDGKDNDDVVYDISQSHFLLADGAVMLAQNYSERYLNNITTINSAIVILSIILVIVTIAALILGKKESSNKQGDE